MKSSIEIHLNDNLDCITSLSDTFSQSEKSIDRSIDRNDTGSLTSKSFLSLESLIEDNPSLTGPEIIALYKSEIETQNLKRKSYLRDKLIEISKNKEQTFVLKNHSNRNIAVKVKEYFIENDNLYVKTSTIDYSYNSVLFKEDQVFDYNYFNENIVRSLDIHNYFSMENNYRELTHKLTHLQ